MTADEAERSATPLNRDSPRRSYGSAPIITADDRYIELMTSRPGIPVQIAGGSADKLEFDAKLGVTPEIPEAIGGETL